MEFAFLFIATALTVLFIIMFFLGLKNSKQFTGLSESEYPLNWLYFVGFTFLEKIGYKFVSSADLEAKKSLEILGDKRYSDYYLRVIRSAQVTLLWLSLIFASVIYALTINTLFLFLSVVVGFLAVYYYGTLLSKQIKQRQDEIMKQFCYVVSQLALLANCGTVPRQAWEIVANGSDSVIHQEMRKVTEKINNAVPESQALGEFAMRSGLSDVKKFVTIYLEGLKKGSAQFAKLLEDQSDAVWNARKQQVLRLGENAGLKLMIPSAIMFIGIIILVVVPMFSAFAL